MNTLTIMKSLNLKPMTDKEIRKLVKKVKKQRTENPEFKPEIGQFVFKPQK